MNSNPRGTQTPPRPQPQRPSPKRQDAPRHRIHPLASVSTGFWVILAVTVLLLAAMIVTMTVMLCIADEPTPSVEPPVGGQPTAKPQEETTNSPTPPVRSTKTGISLPCATKSGTYWYSPEEAVDMSDYEKLDSEAAALIDVTNGRAVAGKNGSTKIYPASMTKVMTVLVACEEAEDPTALLTVTDAMVEKYRLYDGPSTAHEWQAGYQVTVEDALYMAIYESDTYACWLLAEYVAGTEEAFVQMMNSRAAKLGCVDTNFTNCTGLFSESHYTTCFDMAAIMAAAMNNEAAAKVLTANQQYTADIYINGVKNSGLAVPMWSGWYTGRLEAYRYGGAAAKYAGNGSDIELIAGKTGYETIPTNCFVTAGRNDVKGTLFVCVQVGRISENAPKITSKQSTDDTREIYQEYANY